MMHAGGPAMPFPDAPRRSDQRKKAVNRGFDLLEAQTQALQQRLAGEAAIAAAPSGDDGLETGSRAVSRAAQQRRALQSPAHKLGVTYARPDPTSARMPAPSGHETAKQAVIAGPGIAFMSALAVAAELDESR
jgi:hypothetical protein